MSYILEALKKADRERNLGDVPDLESAHWGVRKTPNSSRWPWVVAILLLFNAALLIYMLGDDVPEADDQAGGVNKSSTDAPARTATAARAPLQRLPNSERKPSLSLRPKVNYPAPLPVAPVPKARAVPAKEPASGTRVVESPTPLPVSDSESQLPEWGELSLEFRSGFTLPHIDVHVYAEEPARRFVLIDLKKYREGDSLANGAVLEKIGPGSIQLFYQGTHFRVDK